MNLIEVKVRERTEQWLGAHEPHGCVGTAEMVEPKPVLRALDAHAHPQVRWPAELRTKFGESPRSLRKQLILMLRSTGDNVEHVMDVSLGNPCVKQVAHRIYED